MIFVDSGGWFASVVPTDPDYGRAIAWLAANRARLITTDYVVDETLTLLRARGQRKYAIDMGVEFFHGALTIVHFVTQDQIRRAWDIFRTFTDKDWSFTDCTSKVVMEDLGITTAFSFDQHFRQFGTITVVP
jgi:predicted nucleic acid-binding protein